MVEEDTKADDKVVKETGVVMWAETKKIIGENFYDSAKGFLRPELAA